MTDVALIMLATFCGELKHVAVDCRQLTGASLTALARVCPKLMHVG